MHKRTKATAIPKKVKDAVWERDGGKCIVCGYYPSNPCCHILSRSHSGRGIETNIITLCNEHHFMFDSGNKSERERIGKIITAYMKGIYGDEWSKESQAYSKF